MIRSALPSLRVPVSGLLALALLLPVGNALAQKIVTPPLAYFDFEGDDDATDVATDKATADGSSNGTVATDANVDLDVTGAPFGISPGEGVGFSGSIIDIPGLVYPTNFVANGGGDYSIACWIKASTIVDDRWFVGQRDQGIHCGIFDGTKLRSGHWGNDYSGTTNLTSPIDYTGEWIHAVYTYDLSATTGRIYLNGEFESTMTNQGAPDKTGNMIFGGRDGKSNSGNGRENFVGDMDDVAMWDVILSDQNVLDLYNGADPLGNALTEDGDSDNLLDGLERRLTDSIVPGGDVIYLSGTATGTGPGNGTGDYDGDGLSDLDEITVSKTDPTLIDTDGDGLNDSDELNPVSPRLATDPLLPDSDGDGLTDLVENNTGPMSYDENDPNGFTGTNPSEADTDADGFDDNVEIDLGADPTDSSSVPTGTGLPYPEVGDVDDFEDGIFNSSFWTTDLNIPQGNASVTEQNGRIELVGRGHLISRVEHDPEVAGLAICGDWTYGDGSDFMQILTQSDGQIDPGNCCGETLSGVEFIVNAENGDLVIRGRGGLEVTQTTTGTVGNVSGGDSFEFIVIDDGTDLIFVVSEIVTTGMSRRIAISTATVTADAVNRNFIVFHNREGATRTSYIDNLSIRDHTNSDADVMHDWWEIKFGTNENVDDGAASLDGDLVSNENEWLAFTNPADGDTDGDGLLDHVENNSGVFVSASMTGTDPRDFDSDDDGLLDGVESGSGMFVDANDTGTDPNVADTDMDGLADNVETGTGIFVDANNTGSDPNKVNSDGDAFNDPQEVLAGTNPSDTNSTPSIATPLVYFDFEEVEPATATVVTDKSGNAHDGTIQNNGVLLAGVSGPPNGSSPTTGGRFSSDAGVGHLTVPTVDMDGLINDLPAIDEGSYTLSCWLRPNATTAAGSGFIFGQTFQGVHNGVRDGGNLATAHWGSDFAGATVLTADEWVHAAWTYDGTTDTAHIYLNGMLELGPQAQDAPDGSGTLLIGKRADSETPYLGDLDDVAIWPEVLPLQTIQMLALGAPIVIQETAPEFEFKITSIEADPEIPMVSFTFNSISGRKYIIERTSDFVTWFEIDDQFPGATDQSETTFTDNFIDLLEANRPPTNSAPFFYRVREAPVDF